VCSSDLLGLFEESSGRIFCFKLIKRISLSQTSKESFRKLLLEAKKGYHDTVMTHHDPCHDTFIHTSIQSNNHSFIKDKETDIKGESLKSLSGQSQDNVLSLQENLSGNNYASLVYDEWIKTKASYPGDKSRFLQVVWPKIRLFLTGIHSDDVLSAIRSYGEILSKPGQYKYSEKPYILGLTTFFEKHIEEFLPLAKPFENLKMNIPNNDEAHRVGGYATYSEYLAANPDKAPKKRERQD
jgi:hypothetical protein